MAYSALTAEETDANSPLNQSLMDKIRLNIDALYLATGSGSGIVQAGLSTATEEESQSLAIGATSLETFASVGQYGFYPQVKMSAAGTTCEVQLYVGSSINSYATKISMTNTTGPGNPITMYAQIRYITASRDYPIVWITREKSTGTVHGVHFDPSASGYECNMDVHNIADPEILCIELKRNPELCKHLFKNYSKAGESFVHQISIGLWTGALEIGEVVKPQLPETDDKLKWLKANGFTKSYDVVKSGAAPALHDPKVKVVDFKFHLDKC